LDLDLVQEETQKVVAVPRSDLDLSKSEEKRFVFTSWVGLCSLNISALSCTDIKPKYGSFSSSIEEINMY
jgi:hypothetical protein